MSASVSWLDNVTILPPSLPLMRLVELAGYLDAYLRVAAVPDAPAALNGLQLANAGDVTRVAAAVDLCEAPVRMAAEQGSDLLLVHHGLFWGGLKPLTGPAYRRVAGLMNHDMALYSAPLPLDLHPEVGNNPRLAQQLGVAVRGGFGEEYGVLIGVWGELDASRGALQQQLAAVLGAPPRVMPFGPEQVRRVGIILGGGGPLMRHAPAAGPDTYHTRAGRAPLLSRH